MRGTKAHSEIRRFLLPGISLSIDQALYPTPTLLRCAAVSYRSNKIPRLARG